MDGDAARVDAGDVPVAADPVAVPVAEVLDDAVGAAGDAVAERVDVPVAAEAADADAVGVVRGTGVKVCCTDGDAWVVPICV